VILNAVFAEMVLKVEIISFSIAALALGFGRFV
jgi:hypothetical protein